MPTHATNKTSETIGAEIVDRLAEHIGTCAKAAAIFGDRVTHGNTTVIPVARTTFGFGGGTGHSKKTETGEGGGGGALVNPVGYIQLTKHSARFKPIRDPRWLIGLTALGLLLLARTAVKIHTCPTCGQRTEKKQQRGKPTSTDANGGTPTDTPPPVASTPA